MNSNDDALLWTLAIYGGIFIISIFIFCIIRSKIPSLYNPKYYYNKEITEQESPENDGFFEWIIDSFYDIYNNINDDKLIDDGGLDATIFIRLLIIGIKLSLIGCFNGIYLIPLYYTSTLYNDIVNNELDKLNLGYIDTGNNISRIVPVIISCYILFIGSTILLYNEFKWFTTKRHEYLCKYKVSNYSIIISNISNNKLSMIKQYVESILSCNSNNNLVLSINIPLYLDNIEALITKRDNIIMKLEHEYNKYEKNKGKNNDECIIQSSSSSSDDNKKYNKENNIEICINKVKAINNAITMGLKNKMRKYDKTIGLDHISNDNNINDAAVIGKYNRNVCFITLSNLVSKYILLQCIHDTNPTSLIIMSAPEPNDIYWHNIGLSHYKKEVGKLISFIFTLILCILWTIPSAFILAMTQVDELKRKFTFLKEWSDTVPPLEIMLKVISPLTLVLLNILLVLILSILSKLEGHISNASLNASLFGKLSTFFIIQVFFVSAIAGSLFISLKDLINKPAKTIQYILATNLPRQSNYFITFVLVRTFIGLGIEITRIIPYITSIIRKHIGPNLTEKESNRVWLGLKPLSFPVHFELPHPLSDIMLFFMILFVYSILSPIVSLVMLFAFLSMSIIYKHQYTYVYDSKSNDTGGQMWTRAIRTIIMCQLIAQISIITVIIFKESLVGIILMIPLVLLTVIFWIYLEHSNHFKITAYLPLTLANNIDEERKDKEIDKNWLQSYKQDALKIGIALNNDINNITDNSNSIIINYE